MNPNFDVGSAKSLADSRGELYPLSIQKKGDDKWYVFDGRTGGWGKQAFDTYQAAEVVAKATLDAKAKINQQGEVTQ